MFEKQNEKAILLAMNQARFPLLISHENPDGDTLGASLALSAYLSHLNKNHKHFCKDRPASYFNFLSKIENIISDFSKINLLEHDLIIAVDCGSISRLGIEQELLSQHKDLVIINIDHHYSNDHFGHYNLVVPLASSTSEIMYDFFKANQIVVDKYMATSLLTGILSDTMNFTNAATTDKSLQIASELIKQGARANQIVNNLTQNKNLSALSLWGKILDRTKIQPNHNFAYTYINKKDLEESQTKREEIDGIANFLSTLADPDFILVLSEEEDNSIKGSLRTTKNKIDLAKIARTLGGGGHRKAAGFKITKSSIGTGEDWKKFIIDAIINELNKV
jgi:phosphoesterase RecJ-like protein